MDISEERYYEIIDMALSGKYRTRELEEISGRDRHVLLSMCRRENKEPVWRKTKLTTDQIEDIRKLYKQYSSYAEVGRQTEVSHETVRLIVNSLGIYQT